MGIHNDANLDTYITPFTYNGDPPENFGAKGDCSKATGANS